MNSATLYQELNDFALEVVLLCRTFKKSPETFIINKQLIKAATSAAANYRASRCARSRNEWHAKISIVYEEIDESNYWLEFISPLKLCEEDSKLKYLIEKSASLTRIFAKARATSKGNGNQHRKRF